MSQPTCNPACQQKIILNGGRVAAEANLAVNAKHVYTSEEGHELIALLDRMEQELMDFNNKILRRVGYTRPIPVKRP